MSIIVFITTKKRTNEMASNVWTYKGIQYSLETMCFGKEFM